MRPATVRIVKLLAGSRTLVLPGMAERAGSDLYNSYIDAIYTRSINDPQWAGKLTGRTERSSTALLFAQDELSPIVIPFEERTEITAGERSWSAIGRTRYSLGESSYVAGLGTFRALEGGGA